MYEKFAIQKKRAEREGHLEGCMALRVTHRKKGTRRKNSCPCYTISCGCCDEKIEIFYDSEDLGLEINKVNGSLKNWREVLLPLLGIENKDGEFIDVSKQAREARKELQQLREKYASPIR